MCVYVCVCVCVCEQIHLYLVRFVHRVLVPDDMFMLNTHRVKRFGYSVCVCVCVCLCLCVCECVCVCVSE